jgi:hypothetical protein
MTAVEIDESGPDAVVWLHSGPLTVGAVPALGGRILALRLDGHEVLHRDDALIDSRLHRRDPAAVSGDTMGSWLNWGGDKTWPAPQGWDGPQQWAGPPDPVLDGGTYAHSLAGDQLTMTSGHDPRTGLTITRVLEIEGDALIVTSRLTNTGDRPVRWAPWNVLQLPGGDFSAEVEGPDPVRGLLAGTGFPAWTVADGVCRVPAQDVVGKLALPGASGRLSVVRDGHTVTQTFAIDPAAEYPDGGARAEVWLEHPLDEGIEALGGLRPRHRIVESEVLGPLADLEPGGSTELTVRVAVTR